MTTRRPLWALAVLLALVLGNPSAARPEGSASLYPSSYAGVNASRANLDLSGAGASLYVNTVKASTFLYVLAEAGEYIVVGSSNRAGGGDVLVYNPQDFGTPGNETYDTGNTGSPDFRCKDAASPPVKYSGGTLGTLSTRAQELAGPNSADNSVAVANGFAPCAYQASSTGIYGVLFTNATSGPASPNGVVSPAGNFLAFTNTVAAWDVTVRASATSTVNLDGRLFTYAFAGAMGGSTRSLYSSLYYITGDGYRYRQQWQGLDPASYVLYSNTFGFLDNGQPLYRDLRGREQRVTTLPPGVTSQIAQNPIFFSDVTPGGPHEAEVARVLNALSIPLAAPTPIVGNVSFAGNVSGSTSTAGVGGTFTFDSTDTITYQIVISLDGVDFNPENANNRTLTGIAFTGSHAVAWDGKNNALATFPAGGPYSYVVSGRNGEVHFPLVDAESNAWGGPTITRLNGIDAPSTTVYYDDRGYATRSGVLVGNLNGTLCPTATPPPPVPPFSLAGIDSANVTGLLGGQSTYARSWGLPSGIGNANTDCVIILTNPPGTPNPAWGDTKAVDVWTFFSLPATTETLTIIATIIDAAAAIGAPATAPAGSTIQGSFQFANNGTASAPGIVYSLSLNPGLGVVTFGNLPIGTTASYSSVTGVVTFGGTPLPTTLAAGQSVLGANGLPLMNFSYTAPGAGPVFATATISTSGTDDVPANNTASASTGIGATDVVASVSAPATAITGTSVSANFQFANLGAGTAAGATYTASIGTAGNRPAAITFGSVPAGITATYDASDGQVTFTGMPGALVSGQSLFFGLSYTAPAIGAVPIATSISTSSVDANPGNNVASGTTAITAALPSDMSVAITGVPAASSPGALVTGAITCTNIGAGAATDASCGATLFPPGTMFACSPLSPQATLAAGLSITCTLSFTTPATGSTNLIGAAGASNDTDPANNTALVVTRVVTAIDDGPVALDSTGGTVPLLANDTVGDAVPVVGVDISLPTILDDAGLSGLAVSASGDLVVPGMEVPGPYTVTYQICALNPSTACDTATALITIAPPTSDLSVDLAGLPGTAQVGVLYTGTFSCANSPSAAGDALGATCDATGLPPGVVLTGCTISPASAAWTSPATVPIGQTVTCTVAGIPSDAGALTVTGTTSATNDPDPTNNTGTAPVVVAAAPISDMSVAVTGLPAASSPGAIVTATITCTNIGAESAADASCGASGLPPGAELACSPPSPQAALASGLSITCTVSFTTPAAGSATVTGTTGAANDPDPANNSAIAVTRVVTATDDGPVPVHGAGATVPVLANDTVGHAVPVVGVDISLPTIVDDAGLSGLTINEAGELVVPDIMVPGLYTVTYQICALTPSTACDTATVRISVAVGIPVGSPANLAMLALFVLLSGYLHLRWRASRGGP